MRGHISEITTLSALVAPAWPEAHADTDRHLKLGDETRAGENLHESGCDLFEAVFYGD